MTDSRRAADNASWHARLARSWARHAITPGLARTECAERAVFAARSVEVARAALAAEQMVAVRAARRGRR